MFVVRKRIAGFKSYVCQNFSHMYVGEPHIQPPVSQPLILPNIILLSCGQSITLPSLVGFMIFISCGLYNGSELLPMKVYKDGELIMGAKLPYRISNADDSDFGTYTFEILSKYCGSDRAETRLLRQGQFI